MKLAVVGGGSTYTPELVDGFARLRDTLPVEELVLVDPAADRLELVGGLARRIFAKQGHPGRIVTTDRPRRGRRRRRRRAAPAARRRPGRPQRGRDLAAGVRLRRPGDHRRGRAGQGAAHRAGRAGHRRAGPRARNPDAWIVDFTNPVGIVTRALLQAGHRAVGLCNVAIGFQRRFAALLGVDARAGRASTTSGLNHLTWERAVLRRTARTCCRELLAEHGDEHRRRTSSCPRALLRPARRRPVVLPALLLRPRRGGRASSGPSPSRAAEVAAIEQRAAGDVRRPGAGREARAAGAARRRLLLRGRRGPGRLAARRRAATSRWSTSATTARCRSCRRRGDRGAGRGRPRRAPTPLPVDAARAAVRRLIAHVTAYEDLALDAALHGGRGPGRPRRCSRTRWSARTTLADGLTDRLLAHNREYLPWA